MVEMFNIILRDNILSFDYIPERSNLKGHIDVDVNKSEIVSVKYSDYHGKLLYAAQAKAKLMSLLERLTVNELPKVVYSVFF